MLPVHMELKKPTCLKEMQEKYKNAWNVRKELKIKSVRMKTEKRSLERTGHVVRMPEKKNDEESSI